MSSRVEAIGFKPILPLSEGREAGAQEAQLTPTAIKEVPTITIAGKAYDIPQPAFPSTFDINPNIITREEPQAPKTQMRPEDPISVTQWAIYIEELARWNRQEVIRNALATAEDTGKAIGENNVHTPLHNRRKLLYSAGSAIIGLSATGIVAHHLRNNHSSNKDTALSKAPDSNINANQDIADSEPSVHTTSTGVESNQVTETTTSPENMSLREQLASHELKLRLDGWRLTGQIEDLKNLAAKYEEVNNTKSFKIYFDNTTTHPSIEITIDPKEKDGFKLSDGISVTKDIVTKEPISYQMTFFPTVESQFASLQATTRNTTTKENIPDIPIILEPETAGEAYSHTFKYFDANLQYPSKKDIIDIEVISEGESTDNSVIASHVYDYANYGSQMRHVRLTSGTPTISWESTGHEGTGITLNADLFDNLSNDYFDQGYIELGRKALLEVYDHAKDISVDSVALFESKFRDLTTDFSTRLMRAGANGNGGRMNADYFKAFQLGKGEITTDSSSFFKYASPELFYSDIGVTLKENWNSFTTYVEERTISGEMLPETRNMINEICSLYANTLLKINGNDQVAIGLMLEASWDEVSEFIDYERWAGEHTLPFPTEKNNFS